MRYTCPVPGCISKNADIVFRGFPPVDSPLFNKWINAIGNPKLLEMDPVHVFKSIRICNLHFNLDYALRPYFLKNDMPVPTENLTLFTDNSEFLVDDIQEQEEMNMSIPMDITETELLEDIKDLNTDDMHCEVEMFLEEDITNSNTDDVIMTDEPKNNVLLIEKLLKMKRSLRYYKKKCDEYRKYIEKFEIFNNFTKLNNSTQCFIRNQLTNLPRKTLGRTYTLEDKLFALSIFKRSRCCYIYLSNIFALPSIPTLQNILSAIRIEPGINESIFKALNAHVLKIEDNKEKTCSLIFDEMSLNPHFDFDNSTQIVFGFEDDGHRRTNNIADHVQVYMLRSLYSNWKVPLCYTFSNGPTDAYSIKYFVNEIVSELMKIGFNVAALICDQAPTNVKTINMLIEETRLNNIKLNKRHEPNIICIGNNNIVPLYDICHIIKCFRNNLLNKKLCHYIGNKKQIASWDDIKNSYLTDCLHNFKIIPKITEEHVIENRVRKMKVSHAAQVFSKSMSSAIYTYFNNEEALGTASFCSFMNDLFDSMNGHDISNSAELRTRVTIDSNHLQFWYKSIKILENMKYITASKQPPVIRNCIHTIKGFINLHNILLKEHKFEYFMPISLNQDPLENTFGQIRQLGFRYTNPSCYTFTQRLSVLLIQGTKNHSSKNNCLNDLCITMVDNIHIFLSENLKSYTPTIDIYINSSRNEENINKYLINILSTKPLYNIYSAKAMECSICKENVFKSEFIRIEDVWKYNINNSDDMLNYFSSKFINALKKLINLARTILPQVFNKNCMYAIYRHIIIANINFNYRECEHSHSTEICIIDSIIKTLFLEYIKEMNIILKGQLTTANDDMKLEALKYSIKHNRNQRRLENTTLY